MSAFCAHPGCIQTLQGANVSGVCRAHLHGEACRCMICTSPRNPGGKRQTWRARVRDRGKLQRLGLLTGKPPLDDELPLPIPVPA